MSELFLRCTCQRRIRLHVEHSGRLGRCACGQAVTVPPATLFARSPGKEISLTELNRGVPAPGLWREGRLVDGRYEVKGKLGEGTFGSVWQVRHRDWNIALAVKELRPDRQASAARKRNFQRECQAWIDLGMHPHVVTAWYVRELEGTPYLFLEYCDGGSLADWIDQGKTRDPAIALDVAIQLCWGLAHCHARGIVHRDLKPLNVLLTSDGQARLTDFGAVKFAALQLPTNEDEAIDDPRRTIGGRWQGTPPYMAAEQWQHDATVDHRADLYALGVTLFEMLTGRWPCQARQPGLSGWIAAHTREQPVSLGVVRPELATGLAELVARCLARRVGDRPGQASELAGELIGLFEEVVGKAYPREEPGEVEARATALNNKGVSLFDLGQLDQAEQAWNDALAIDPQHPEASHNLGQVQWRSGRLDDLGFTRLLQQVAASHPDAWQPRIFLAELHLDRGDATSALAALQTTEGDPPPEARQLRQRAMTFLGSRTFPRSVLLRHGLDVTALCLDSRGERIATGSSQGELHLWERDMVVTPTRLPGHEDAVTALCFSPDGSRLLSAGADMILGAWEVASPGKPALFVGHEDAVHALCWLPDGRRFVSGGWDRTIRLWDVNASRCLACLEGHAGAVTSLATSPDGRLLLSGSQDRTSRLWDLASGECLVTLTGHAQAVVTGCFSPDGRLALSGSHDRTLRLWEVPGGRCLRTLTGHADWIRTACFSPDGRLVLSGGKDGWLRVWDVNSGLWLQGIQGHTQAVTAAWFLPDGRSLLSAGRDRSVQRWPLEETRTRVPLALSRTVASEALLAAQATHVQALANARAALEVDDAGAALGWLRQARGQVGYERHRATLDVWASLYRRLERRTLRDGWRVAVLQGHQGPVNALDIHPDGSQAITAGEDGTVRLWDLATGNGLLVWRAPLARSIGFSPDGKVVVAACEDDVVRTWETRSGQALPGPEHVQWRLRQARFTPDARFLVMESVGGSWALWSLAEQRLYRRQRTDWAERLTGSALGPDGRFLMQVSEDGKFTFWSLVTGERVRNFPTKCQKVSSAAWSGEGRYLVAGSGLGGLEVWEAPPEPRRSSNFGGHGGEVEAVCFSPDSRFALSGGVDTTVRLWSLESGQCLRIFQGHTRAVQAVRFTPDARHALSASADGTCVVWFLDWELSDREPADWDHGAASWLERFLTLHTPCVEEPGDHRGKWGRLWRQVAGVGDEVLTEERIRRALTRRGRARWTQEEFGQLLRVLGEAGFGWLRPEGVRRELETLATSWVPPGW